MKRSYLTGLIIMLSIMISANLFSQNVAINTTGAIANSSSILDISATNMGLLIPRVALTATNMPNPITTPATSLLVYNTATAGVVPNNVTPGFYYWNGTQWVRFMMGNGNAWLTTGNSGTNAPTNFIGTTDAMDFVVKTNNLERVWITSSGNTGLNTASPNQILDVNGSVAIREGLQLNLINGNNNDVNIGTNSFLRIAGPSAAFSITGIAGGTNGRIITLINNTWQQLTIAHEDVGSAVTNRIYTPGGTGIVLPPIVNSTITLQYSNSLQRWVVISDQTGSLGCWTRPSGQPYIQNSFNNQAKVYDPGQTFAYAYEGTNQKGSYFTGLQSGLVVHRNAQPIAQVPTFGTSNYPFVDVGNDGDVTSADNITYTAVYGNGGTNVGVTGIGNSDAGIRGIGLGLSTNSTSAITGVLGEVVGVGVPGSGQQGVFGWQAASSGTNPYCPGVYGVSSQSGNMSGGVIGQYFNLVDDPDDGFNATFFNSTGNHWGALGYGATSSGVYGFSRTTGSIVRGVHGEASCAAGNLSFSYGGFFSTSGSQDSRTVYATYAGGTTNYAGYFAGNHLITGTKSTAFLNDENKPVLMYCTEMPEVWFEDVGSGIIVNNQSQVMIPNDMLAGIKVDANHPIKVFITPTSPIGNYWVEKIEGGFILHAEEAADESTFDWRIMAKRKGYEDRRLDYAGADVSVDPIVIDPYSNLSNDSKVNWREDINSKKEALNEIREFYKTINLELKKNK